MNCKKNPSIIVFKPLGMYFVVRLVQLSTAIWNSQIGLNGFWNWPAQLKYLLTVRYYIYWTPELENSIGTGHGGNFSSWLQCGKKLQCYLYSSFDLLSRLKISNEAFNLYIIIGYINLFYRKKCNGSPHSFNIYIQTKKGVNTVTHVCATNQVSGRCYFAFPVWPVAHNSYHNEWVSMGFSVEVNNFSAI